MSRYQGRHASLVQAELHRRARVARLVGLVAGPLLLLLAAALTGPAPAPVWRPAMPPAAAAPLPNSPPPISLEPGKWGDRLSIGKPPDSG